jgi:hypothetical protein
MAQLEFPLTKPFNNRGLFADNYLENRLSQDPEWSTCADLEEKRKAVQMLFKAKSASFNNRLFVGLCG